ncbi:MAG: hypothetical protein BZY81_06810 [SAR202 cluster bacterium Io17-Chloro-G4]|nr:MAG: hypothetical protein BZY81_06810 [SAR202 cluster bacterium Io17-Chloro-G4]
MDSVEVAVRFTEAIMANSGSGRKGTDPAQAYADMFAQMLERVKVILEPVTTPLPLPPRPAQANSTVFPLTHER